VHPISYYLARTQLLVTMLHGGAKGCTGANFGIDLVSNAPMIKFSSHNRHSMKPHVSVGNCNTTTGNHVVRQWQKMPLACKVALVCDLMDVMALHYLLKKLVSQQTTRSAALATSTQQWEAQHTKSLARWQHSHSLWKAGLIGMAAVAGLMHASTTRSRLRRKHVVEDNAPVSRDALMQNSALSTDVDSTQSDATSNDGHHGSEMSFDQDDWLQLESDKMGDYSRPLVVGQLVNFAHCPQFFGQLGHELNSHQSQQQIVNLQLPEKQHQQQEQSEQQEQQQQQDVLLSHELSMESDTDLCGMENMPVSDDDDDDDNGSSKPSGVCKLHRRFTEPACNRGHAGFVRQRTCELNNMRSQPVFPWLSERCSIGSDDGHASIIRTASDMPMCSDPGLVLWRSTRSA